MRVFAVRPKHIWRVRVKIPVDEISGRAHPWIAFSRPGELAAADASQAVRHCRSDQWRSQCRPFDNNSRSCRSCLTSRRSWPSSSRSALVKSPERYPSSAPACLTHSWIVPAQGSYSRARPSTLRPARASATSCSLNSAGHGFLVLGTKTLSFLSRKVSIKPGELQSPKKAVSWIWIQRFRRDVDRNFSGHLTGSQLPTNTLMNTIRLLRGTQLLNGP